MMMMYIEGDENEMFLSGEGRRQRRVLLEKIKTWNYRVNESKIKTVWK
jgi:hypothetical protein